MPDDKFRLRNGKMMNPSDALKSIRGLAEVAMVASKMGLTVQAGITYAHAMDGFEALDDWLSEGNHLPAEWSNAKPE